MTLRFLALEGDGIGPEIMAATLAVLGAIRPILRREVEVRHALIGFAALEHPTQNLRRSAKENLSKTKPRGAAKAGRLCKPRGAGIGEILFGP